MTGIFAHWPVHVPLMSCAENKESSAMKIATSQSSQFPRCCRSVPCLRRWGTLTCRLRMFLDPKRGTSTVSSMRDY